ncbi:MAG: Rpn family recombination-promoting nuclease/putative transposase [Oscillospiraceae bacterium]|nr:Rpn family recombination-promoting nuclease/putative transposase [Oscillospiraceae bacterium]
MVAQRNPQIKRAAVKLRELSADEKARDMFERREKGRRDVAAMVDGKTIEIARNAKSMGMDTDTIMKLTGMARDAVEAV